MTTMTTEAELSLLLRTVRLEAEGVVSLEFVSPDGADLPEWTPGAHLEIDLPSGLVRQYSLCSDPNNRKSYRVAVLREPESRGGSAEVHDTLRVGQLVTVRGPRNHFELVDADDYVLIAGGIGVTPLIAMARTLSRSGKSWHLHYGGRSLDSMILIETLSRWRDNVTFVPQDEEGVLDIDGILAQVKETTAIYCCGPGPLLDAVKQKAEAAGVADRLHIERFTASDEALAEIETAKSGDGFDVELARSGRTVWVDTGRTVLEALREVIPDLPSSCEEGVCGTCETRVLGGIPEHHDQILTDAEREEGDCMFICVSRSKTSKLVLDL